MTTRTERLQALALELQALLTADEQITYPALEHLHDLIEDLTED